MIREILGEGGLLARALSAYEPRQQQLEMAQTILDALQSERPAVVEAGTGTGKTLAYLVPAILSGRKVIVSTGTKTLQEQIFAKDIPLLQKVLPVPFKAACMKGIGNYLCLRRFKEATGVPAAVRAWAEHTRSGDRAELGELPDGAPVWADIQSTPETRLGARCDFFEDCYVTQMRRTAAAANIVIVNHSLFFADLALRAEWPQAQVVPTYEAAIFDEAHSLEDIATDYFGVQVSSYRLSALAREMRRLEPDTLDLASRIDGHAQALFGRVMAQLGLEARGRLASTMFTGQVQADYHALDNVLDEAEARLARNAEDEVRALAQRAHAIRTDLALLVEQTDRRYVYWAETTRRGAFLHGSPIDVGPILHERLIAQLPSLIFTSATLSVGGSFDYFCSRIGLPAEDTRKLALPSPFDYERQALLYVPRDLPEPQGESFLPAATDRMIELLAVTQGRAFLLFTSYRNLRAAEQRLRRAELPYPLLVQGERPKERLLEAFRSRVGSVLLATASFWEGVDVAGEALQLVVIDKLPFAPPDDPVGAARIDQLREKGRDPFRDYQVPRAALLLKQGFGRLIRHRQDRGIVAVLDRRIVEKGYGKTFLRSLPSGCPKTSSLEEVRTWWTRS